MLELRPNCERCDRDLPPGDRSARICSYECTFCAACVDVMGDICPKCGGKFAPRPIRPMREWLAGSGLGLGFHPAGLLRRHGSWSEDHFAEMARRVGHTSPEER